MQKPQNMQEYDGYSLPERKDYSAEELEKLKEISNERMKRIYQENKIMK